jgi:hypothetical protein
VENSVSAGPVEMVDSNRLEFCLDCVCRFNTALKLDSSLIDFMNEDIVPQQNVLIASFCGARFTLLQVANEGQFDSTSYVSTRVWDPP